jgi:Na+-driven multidrug efflux pump
MEAMKITLSLISWIFGLPVTILGIAINLDNWKSAVIFVLAVIFWALKIFITWRKERQRYREKELELEQKEFEIKKAKE